MFWWKKQSSQRGFALGRLLCALVFSEGSRGADTAGMVRHASEEIQANTCTLLANSRFFALL